MKIDDLGGSQQIVQPARQTTQTAAVTLEKSNDQSQGDKKQKNKTTFSDKELENGISALNDTVKALHKELKFKVHEGSGRMMVEVINMDNNKVIKEIPPEQILDMMGRIKKMVGLILDEKI